MLIATFLKQATNIGGKMSASQFIGKHREYLCQFERVSPILAMLEKGRILPTPALTQILTLLALEKDPHEKTQEVLNPKTGEVKVKSLTQVEKASLKKEKKTPRYVIFLYLNDGTLLPEQFPADDYGEAMRISYRKLFRREDSTQAEILGLGVSTFIDRNDAVAEILRKGPTPATKREHKGGGSGLGWKVSAKSFVAKFSKG